MNLSPAAILAAVSAAFCPAPFTVVRRVGGFSGSEMGAVVVTEATFDGSRWLEVRIGATSVVALRGAGPAKTKADKDERRAQLVTLRRIVEVVLANLAREAALWPATSSTTTATSATARLATACTTAAST